MKNIRTMITDSCDKLDGQWRKLPAGKQRKYVILFFAGYLLLTGGVIMTVWYDSKTGTAKQKTITGHITNPIVEQEKRVKDSSSSTTKNKDHERQ